MATEKLSTSASLYYDSLIQIREDEKVEFKDNIIKRKYNEYLDRLLANVSKNANS